MSDKPSAENESIPRSVKESQDIYFVQVSDADAAEMKQIADSLTGFLQDPDAEALVVPENVKPLNRDEAKQYLEEMANALDMEVNEAQ